MGIIGLFVALDNKPMITFAVPEASKEGVLRSGSIFQRLSSRDGDSPSKVTPKGNPVRKAEREDALPHPPSCFKLSAHESAREVEPPAKRSERSAPGRLPRLS